ncbi:hypothetical protein OCEANICA350_12251 [Oceanicaulis sp. 350]|nr:hypothetical protein OCEANICA350_12251 [Oceanicaulis sp. 350]
MRVMGRFRKAGAGAQGLLTHSGGYVALSDTAPRWRHGQDPRTDNVAERHSGAQPLVSTCG